jgi:hypothetical protein
MVKLAVRATRRKSHRLPDDSGERFVPTRADTYGLSSLCPPANRLGRPRGLRGTGRASSHGPCRRYTAQERLELEERFNQKLSSAGLHDLADTRPLPTPRSSPSDWRRQAKHLLQHCNLKAWDERFLRSLLGFQVVSEKQLAVLRRIAHMRWPA